MTTAVYVRNASSEPVVEWCEARGWSDIRVFSEADGVDGAVHPDKRGALGYLMAELTAYDRLVVATLFDLSRIDAHLYTIAARCRGGRVQLLSAGDDHLMKARLRPETHHLLMDAARGRGA